MRMRLLRCCLGSVLWPSCSIIFRCAKKCLLGIVLFLVLINEVVAMSILDAGKVCLFSKISGVITRDGKPAANAQVIRRVNFNRDKIDQVITDQNGYFEMPAVFQRTVTKFLPQEFVASQAIDVTYQDRTFRIWESVKRSPKENVEAKGKPLVVTCELNSEERSVVVDRVPIHGLCTWDVEVDAQVDWTQP